MLGEVMFPSDPIPTPVITWSRRSGADNTGKYFGLHVLQIVTDQHNDSLFPDVSKSKANADYRHYQQHVEQTLCEDIANESSVKGNHESVHLHLMPKLLY